MITTHNFLFYCKHFFNEFSNFSFRGIPRPWRIVFPAVIAFGVMSIVSLIHLLVMNSAYRDFCGGLANNLETKTLK